MNETKEKKPFATPKQYALGAVILVTVIFSFLSVMLSSFMEENLGAHIAILLGGVTGVLFYLGGKKMPHGCTMRKTAILCLNCRYSSSTLLFSQPE